MDRPMRLLLPLVLLATAAAAQDPATDASCANVRVALPAELAGWSDQTSVSAGTRPGEGATVEVGKALRVSLHPAKHLSLAPAPEKAPGVDSNGGALAMAIVRPGTYRVALGGAAWIDLVIAGKAVAATAHGHGPKCTGIRKLVDFKLQPGSYTIQLSGSGAESVTLMVAKLG